MQTNSRPTLTPVTDEIDLVLSLFSRGEAFDVPGFANFFVDSPVYAFGNFEICLSKDAIASSAANFFSQIRAVYHDIKKIWRVADVIFVEMDVSYWRKADNSQITLPCCDIFRMKDGRFSELRIFMDVEPVLQPHGTAPDGVSVFTIAAGAHIERPKTMRQFYEAHPEGRARVEAGFVPRWSIDGPTWPIKGSSPKAG